MKEIIQTYSSHASICLLKYYGNYYLAHLMLPLGSWTIDMYNDWVTSWIEGLPLSEDILPQLLKPSKISIVYTISGLLKGLFEDNGIEQRNVICSFHEIYNRCFMAEDPKEEFKKYVEEQFREQILGGGEND